MEQNTPYPLLMRAPLKMRGVFGLSWQLYKRGFWPMFGFTLLLVGLFLLIFMLVMFSVLEKTDAFADIEDGMRQFGTRANTAVGPAAVASMLGVMGIMWLIWLAYSFLVIPAYLGATFLEMDQRMEGRGGTLYQLLRYALPMGFKRFYTTFLSMYVVQILGGITISLVLPLIMLFRAVGIHLGGTEGGLVWLLVFYLIMVLSIVTYMILISLIYPVAAHEGKRAFKAVGRAFRLSFRNFGRLFGAMVLFMLFMILSSVVCLLPTVLFQWHNITLTLVMNTTCVCLWASLFCPYFTAFCTALYVDSAARMPDIPGGETDIHATVNV